MSGFVHFDIRTEYSMGESVVRIPELASLASERGERTLGIADPNLHGMIKFYDACRKFGVKPVVGMGVLTYTEATRDPSRIVLICIDDDGYRNLLGIVARSMRNAECHGAVPIDDILRANAGLAALTGGQRGLIGEALLAEQASRACELTDQLSRVFKDRLYMEISRIGRPDEEQYIAKAVNLAHEKGLPLLATNEVCFLKEEDFNIQRIRSCIRTGDRLENSNRVRDCEPLQYFRPAEEMRELFHDLPDAIENSIELSVRCHHEMRLGTPVLPETRLSADTDDVRELKRRAEEGLEMYLNQRRELPSGKNSEQYRERLEYELEVIGSMGFSGYFLIVNEIVAWAKSNGIPVGPGRGSGSASLVSFAIGITAIDPLEYDLLFERLLNPGRVSLPDFDIDFCEERRSEVIAHIAETYGHESVGQIATYNTLAARAVVRDVARVLGRAHGWTDDLAKLIPGAPGVTLAAALEEEARLRQTIEVDENAAEIFELGKSLEGLVRSVGKHAGGVVIAPGSLEEYVPFYTESASGTAISQFDKDDVENAGLVKFDFLGLTTLTVIERALKMVNEKRGELGEDSLVAANIPLDDAPTFKTIQSCDTIGIFQLESEGMNRIIRDLKPDRMEDIVALVALFRPGPLETGGVDRFIRGKHSRNIEYKHPLLEPVLRTTYGEMLYQEDVMNVSRAIAGFSLGEADLMRKAMGKKDKKLMKNLREKFLAGASANSVEQQLASSLFAQMEKFSGYAFNKAHATGYAMLAFQTAWLKTRYPAEFFAALMSSSLSNVKNLKAFCADMKRHGVALLPPDVNTSPALFRPLEGDQAKCVRYGLAAIRGIGIDLSQSIVDQRNSADRFSSLYDLCARVGPKLSTGVLEKLIFSGALDSLGESDEQPELTRAKLYAGMESARQAAESDGNRSHGVLNLFDEAEARETALQVDAQAWTYREMLEHQGEALGFRLEGHPVDDYREELRFLANASADRLDKPRKNVRILGVIEGVRRRRDRNGEEYATLRVSDATGSFDAWVFSRKWDRYRGAAQQDALVLLKGELSASRSGTDACSFAVSGIFTIEEGRRERGAQLVVRLEKKHLSETLIGKLETILEAHRGKGTVPRLEIEDDGWLCDTEIASVWRVGPTDDLIEALSQELGSGRIRIEYPSQGVERTT